MVLIFFPFACFVVLVDTFAYTDTCISFIYFRPLSKLVQKWGHDSYFNFNANEEKYFQTFMDMTSSFCML